MANALHPSADLASLGRHRLLLIRRGLVFCGTAGSRFVEGIGVMWYTTVGYANREIAETMSPQAEKLCYYTPFGAASLAAALPQLALGDLNRRHFATGGSTAVESPLRLCHYYFGVIGQPEKGRILSRMDAYHGAAGQL